jgi:hypothetical protein
VTITLSGLVRTPVIRSARRATASRKPRMPLIAA